MQGEHYYILTIISRQFLLQGICIVSFSLLQPTFGKNSAYQCSEAWVCVSMDNILRRLRLKFTLNNSSLKETE